MAKKAKKKREFRSKESYAAEATTRDLINPLLQHCEAKLNNM